MVNIKGGLSNCLAEFLRRLLSQVKLLDVSLKLCPGPSKHCMLNGLLQPILTEWRVLVKCSNTQDKKRLRILTHPLSLSNFVIIRPRISSTLHGITYCQKCDLSYCILNVFLINMCIICNASAKKNCLRTMFFSIKHY